MATEAASSTPSRTWMTALNTRYHRAALGVFAFIVVAHWAEHIAQAIQVYVLGWPLPQARGVLGLPFPWLVTSEWMHYGYALLMLIGLLTLRRGFSGRARVWWNVSLGIQVWHHFEHLLLLLQAMTGDHLLGRPVPTSIIQLLVPRMELHLFYNTIVTIPMVVAMILHRRPSRAERALMVCTCAAPVAATAAAAAAA
ncbi:hypothetical protein [Microbispora sp. ATCC PTA-5024]|uniref:hypothetical protein n=1 Tax=Microbispora sp. ATCC PTA-5024 TaxID=316330 RepID=UPI0003DD611C|nr:hypothetical protein [Microbispora sp. ATCC PTA-5024]ETK37194.1 hypothetical protein MPTA5024_05115 [Microbispora sp. ATCC PTA-5024]